MTSSKTSKASPRKTGSNSDKVIALLKRDSGASLADMTKATGWQAHSARAVLTGFRKKGFILEKTKADGVTRYKITAEPAA